MVSTLASQLQALREAGAGSKQRTDTFLYDPREAARVDNETIYNLAWNGLLELKQMDARFEEFDTNHEIARLFSRQRINFHRAQATKQEDADLNGALAKVLDALSGYFLLGATHKILEFLVRRYEIHRFNVDDVMATIVSYHESPWFAKMVRILHIHNTRWEFLLQVKQSGEPLLRAALVQRALDESSIVEFLFTSATRIGASNPKLISLYTLVTLQMLEQTKVREETLRWLIPQLLTSLKSAAFPELQSSAFMVVTKLASKAILTEKVIDTLAKHLVKYAQPGTQMNALLCVIFLAQVQPSFHISKGVGKYLVGMESIVDLLGDAVQSYETTKFVRALVLFLVDSLAAVDDNTHNLLRSVSTNVAFSDELVDELVNSLMAQAQKDRFDEESARVAVVSDVLVVLSKQHVGKVDAAVHAILGAQGKTQLSKKEVKLANKFVAKTFGNVANSAHFLPSTTDAKTSLALALEHPTESTRYQALVSLDKQNQAAPAEPVLTNGSVLLRRMVDDSERIAKFVITSSLGDLVLKTTSKKKSFETIVQVVHKWSRAPSSSNARSVLDTIVTFALTKFRSVHSSDNDDNLFKLLLAFASTEISQKKEKKPLVRAETLAKWLSTLEHPFSAALATAIKKTKEGNAPVLVDVFGATLADNVQRLLPFCLSWSQRSDVIAEPCTELLVRVLHAARNALKQKKNAAKDQAALDQSFRFILKKEFAAVCEQQAASPSAECKSMPWAIQVADLLRQVALDTFTASRDEFDACVATLLQAPTLIFLNVQGSLLQLFQESEAMERELLPTMARLVTSNSVDVMALLVKSRALDIVSAVLEGSAYETYSADELTRVVHVVPSVLVALADAATSVRQSAIVCLDRWLVSCSDAVLKSRSSDLSTLLNVTKFLMNAKQDIIMDANAVAVLCGTFATASKKDSATFYQLLINYISSASTEELPVAVKLLDLLAHVTETAFWLQSVDYFQQTLMGLVSASSSNNHVNTVLTTLLSHFLDVNVAITTTGAKKQPSVPKPFVEALFAVLSCSSEALARVQTLQVHALLKLSPMFYDALDDVNRFVLVAKLLKLLVVADESVAGALIACLNTLPVQYEVFVKLLEDELSVATAADSKKKPVETRFQDLSCVLEVLAVKVDGTTASSNLSESVASANLLLKALCDVLALFCAKENESVVSEYILQVLFGCLRRVCEVSAASSATAEQPAAGKRNAKHRGAAVEVEPELLVKHTLGCLSRTSSPQTRNEALLFVSALVDLFPASVLKSLEKILSFVGGGSIHQDDEYSFHVLETIVKSVVPHILDSQSSAAEGLITTQQFIRIFVDAYDQIPLSRRELLFSVLVEALGRDSLAYCVVALLQKSAMIGMEPQMKELTAFAHSLCFACDATLQISTLVSVLKIARDLFPHVIEDSDTDTDDVDDDEDVSGDANGDAYEPFVVDEKLVKTKAKMRALNSALVAFVPAHLQARELHHKILSLQNKEQQIENDDGDEHESESDQLQQSYLMLAQVVLLYFRRVAREQSLQQEHDDDSGNESASTSFWSSLATEIIEVLTVLQKLLSTPGFVAVIGELLHHENSMVRKKAMQLFNERLQEERASLTSGEELLFVDMLDELEVILQNADGSENTVNVQTALLSVDILARNFATTHAKRFQQSLPTVVKYIELDPSTASPTTLHLFGCAFVCISSICRAVGALVFPLLPKFFPKLLAGITFCSSKLKPVKGEDKAVASGMVTVLQCLLASLEVFTEKIPQFLAPYLSKILQVLLAPSILASNGSASSMQVQLSIDCSLLNLSNNVELRHLLPNVFGAYEFALVQGDVSVEKLFSLVSTIVAALDVSSLRQYLPNFARFFVTALDARRVHASKMQDVDAVEDEILECLVQFVLKLSEKQLKPLFLKIAEWAQAKLPGSGANKNGDISRRISFFKLVVKLSERLRGIFVPYYAHVLDYLTATLVDTHSVLAQKKNRKAEADDEVASDDDDDDFFTRDDAPASKKTKMANGHASAVGEVTESVRETHALLLRTTVRALNGCFVHDSDGFMEKERFDVVMSPLVDVFDVVKYDASAKNFVYDVVTSCVANLAWAAKSDLLWKPLHYAVLMKSRSDSSAVRLATLKTVEKCYQVIGDEFLAMLPESIPFLAELMEDTDAEVERTCHQVIKQIEEISGESLDQYLTS